eukprot:1044665-Prymnesium_polylepis.2
MEVYGLGKMYDLRSGRGFYTNSRDLIQAWVLGEPLGVASVRRAKRASENFTRFRADRTR